MVYLPRPARRLGAALLTGCELALADMRQDGAEVLVLDDACLGDLAQLVEGRVRQLDTIVLDRQATIRIVDDGDPLATQTTVDLGRLEHKEHLVVLQGQAVRDRALLAPSQALAKIVALAQRAMEIPCFRRGRLLSLRGGLAKRTL